MADIPAIPSKINNYNVYNVAERLIGVGDEVTLPDFEAMADTISGAGSWARWTTPLWATSPTWKWKSRSA